MTEPAPGGLLETSRSSWASSPSVCAQIDTAGTIRAGAGSNSNCRCNASASPRGFFFNKGGFMRRPLPRAIGGQAIQTAQRLQRHARTPGFHETRAMARVGHPPGHRKTRSVLQPHVIHGRFFVMPDHFHVPPVAGMITVMNPYRFVAIMGSVSSVRPASRKPAPPSRPAGTATARLPSASASPGSTASVPASSSTA